MFFFSASSPSSIASFTCLPGSCITLKIKSCHFFLEYPSLGSEFLLTFAKSTVSTPLFGTSDCLTFLQYCPRTPTYHTMSTVWPRPCRTYGRLSNPAVMSTSQVDLQRAWNIRPTRGLAHAHSLTILSASNLTKHMSALCHHPSDAPRSTSSFLPSNQRCTTSSSSRSSRNGARTSLTAPRLAAGTANSSSRASSLCPKSYRNPTAGTLPAST